MLYQYFANLDNLADDIFLSPLTPLGQKILLYVVSTFSILPLPGRKSFTEKRVYLMHFTNTKRKRALVYILFAEVI